MEVIIKGYSQLYGGGTYTVGLSQIKEIPIPDMRQLSQEQQTELIDAYRVLVDTQNREILDKKLFDMLQLDKVSFKSVSNDLIEQSFSAKKKV